MLVEDVELSLGLVDLGHLDELALMALFGNAHSHRVTRGTGHGLLDITDIHGARLYGGYYWTHLRVPFERRLEHHRVFDRVEVGVEVGSFGSLLLASSYALGRPGELDASDSSRWDLDALPSMRGGNTFFVDDPDANFRASPPRPGSLATLPKLTAPPPALERFRRIRETGIAPDLDGPLRHADPLSYRLISGRDIRPGRGVMFARWVQIADVMERELLTERISPALSSALVDRLSLVERETCYFANRRGEATLHGTLRARLVPPDIAGDEHHVVVGTLDTRIEIADDKQPLIAARARKRLIISRADTALVADAESMMRAHAG